MEILATATQVILIEVLIGRWSSWKLLLHWTNQLVNDFIHLITSKQTGHLDVGIETYALTELILMK